MEKVSGIQIFWTVVGVITYVWASGWFVTSWQRWSERVIGEINKTRPPHEQFPNGGWALGPFKQWELQEAMWQHDPKGFKRMLLKLAAVMLLGLAVFIRAAILAKG